MFQNKSEAWLRWVVRGRSGSRKREKFALGPLQRRSVTNWGEGDEWGHSLSLMKELLLGPEWGWAHLHHIGVHKPVTSKITQEALWDSHPSNRLGFAWKPGASISAWQLLKQSKLFLCIERTLCEINFEGQPPVFVFFKWGSCQWLSHVKSSRSSHQLWEVWDAPLGLFLSRHKDQFFLATCICAAWLYMQCCL